MGFFSAFLAVWAASLLFYGAVAPWAVAATTAALAVLNLLAPGRASRATTIFLGAIAAVFALQLLPLAPLFPFTTALRRAHDVGVLRPGTADTFLTLRSLAQVASYALAGLLVLRLRQKGLATEGVLKGVVIVLALEAAYALVQVFAGLKDIPFYGPRGGDSASGTLVNRNHFAGLMSVGLVAAVGLAIVRFSYPPGRPRRFEAGLPWALAAALFAVAILLSTSRGGAIAAATGLAAFPLLYRGRARAAGLLALLAIGAVAIVAANPTVLVERFESVENDRLAYWTTTASAGARQPVLGFGVGTHPRAYHPIQPPEIRGQVDHAHNEYVNAFFEGGAAWLAVLVAGLAVWFARARADVRLLQGPDRALGAAAMAGAVAIVVHSFVDFDLRITSVGILFAALLASAAPRVESGNRVAVPIACGAGLLAAAALFLPLRSLALSPYDYELAWEHARKAQRAGDEKLADRRYETVADLWPAHPDLQREVGLWFWEGGQLDRAAKCLRRLRPEDVPAVMAELWERDRPGSDYEAVLPSGPRAAAALAGFLVRRNDWQRAMQVFERGCPPLAANAPAFDGFAASLHEAGQWALEATVLERRLAVKSDAEAYAAAARAWSRLGVHDRALDRASTAARVDPANAAWHALKADVLRAKGDGLGAVEALTAALAAAPLDVSLRAKRAGLYVELEMWAPAAEDWGEVARSRPDDRAAALGLARALARSGDEGGARRALEGWLARHADDAEAQGLLKGLPE